MTSPRALRAVPVVTVALFLVPVVAGLAGTLLPAFGWLPAIGGRALSLAPWRRLVDYPGFGTALATTLGTGIVATVVSVMLAFGFCAVAYGTPLARRVGAWVSPVLATPHAALALGVAFLIAPSGWIARLMSPWLTGWLLPPDIATVGDPTGWPLVVCLVLKEVPYLVLMIAGALHQVPAAAHVAVARSMGYGRVEAWLKVVLPQVYPQVRLPVYAVLAFSLSVVDVALIVGPGNPPTLAVLAVRWFADADIAFYFPAAAAATLCLAVVAGAIAAWRAVEWIAAAPGVRWLERGKRAGGASAVARVCHAVTLAALCACALAQAGMLLWSIAAQWRFPAALPDAWTLATWTRHAASIAGPLAMTLTIGALATLFAVALASGCLENESRRQSRAGARSLWLLYVPLLVPQVAFLFGAQVLLVRIGGDGTLAAVLWSHLVFVLPYVFLSLADPWRALDPRYARTAASLGASPWRVFVRVKLPLLAAPLSIAAAVGFAVSVGQYLPTLFAGNGRVSTLTTDAVTLAAGADRRVIGVYAVLQALLPCIAFAAAAALPRRR